jgi:hypothetical protein
VSQEYQIPSGGLNSDPKSQVYDAIDDIYQDRLDRNQHRTEQMISPTSERLYGIAGDIANARKYRLDSQFFIHAENRNNFIKAASKKIFGRELSLRRLEPLTEGRLKKDESAIGAKLFGSIRQNEHREFFNEDNENWFFYQSLTRTDGVIESITLHYEVLPVGVLRISSDESVPNVFIDGQELNNFVLATNMYHDQVLEQIYDLELKSDKIAA